MKELFINCEYFNEPLDRWNVSSVTDMSFMFYKTHNFNQPLNDWDVSSVTDMREMFWEARDFNKPLNRWDVSSVTDMSYMFVIATTFNHSLNDWDVSRVTDMAYMFYLAEAFDQPLKNWNVSSVMDMRGMFYNAEVFNQPLQNWDVSIVTNMNNMFGRASVFDQPLNDWEVSSVTNMNSMFLSTDAFDHPLNNWNVSSVTSMADMFRYTKAFNQPLNDWDVSGVMNMRDMFFNAISFDQPLHDWDVSNVVDISGIFDNTNLSNCNKKLTYDGFKSSGITLTDYLVWENLCSPPSPPPSPPPPTPPSTSPPPKCTSGSACQNGDPHLHFANGAIADFRGKNNTIFNILSYKGLSFSMKIIETEFLLPKPMHIDGSFFTEAYIILMTSKGKFYVHIDASKHGFEVVNLKTRRLQSSFTTIKLDDSTNIEMKDVRYFLSTSSWEIFIIRKPIYNSLSLFHWRLDVKITPKVGFTEHNVHGILGQTFQKNRRVVNGKLDDYTNKNYLKTEAQAEGVIDGIYTDYIIKSKTSEVFKYSVFDNTEKEVVLVDRVSASSDESVAFEAFEN